MQDLNIEPNKQVSLHFSLSNTQGLELVSTFEHEAETFCIGDGSMAIGLELVLYGLCAGDKQTITLSPQQAFGEKDPDKITKMPISDFQLDTPLKVGLVIAFSTPSGQEMPGIIIELDEQQATVDMNHPLAGQSIVFKVHILSVN